MLRGVVVPEAPGIRKDGGVETTGGVRRNRQIPGLEQLVHQLPGGGGFWVDQVDRAELRVADVMVDVDRRRRPAHQVNVFAGARLVRRVEDEDRSLLRGRIAVDELESGKELPRPGHR